MTRKELKRKKKERVVNYVESDDLIRVYFLHLWYNSFQLKKLTILLNDNMTFFGLESIIHVEDICTHTKVNNN